MIEENKVVSIPVDDIIPNRFQPRLKFNEKELQSLAESISEHGIVSPIIVRKIGDKFEIIAGERRFKAANLIGLNAVPCIVKELDDTESAEVAVIENLQRANLTPIEEAKSYEKLLNKGMTQEQLAKRLGVSQPTIANKVRLLNLCAEVQDALLHSKISERHARSLLQLQDVEMQKNLLNTIITNRLTVRQTDDEVNAILGKIPSAPGTEDIFNVDVDTVKNNAEEIIKPMNNVDFEALLKKDFVEPKVEEEKTQDIVSIPDIIKVDPVVTPSPVVTPTVTPVSTSTSNAFASTPAFGEPEEINPFQTVTSEPAAETFDISSYLKTPTINPVATPEVIPEPVQNPGTAIMDEFLAPKPSVELIQETQASTKKISTAINAARDMTRTLEGQGFKVDTEEFDFADMYQIVIKIKKD